MEGDYYMRKILPFILIVMILPLGGARGGLCLCLFAQNRHLNEVQVSASRRLVDTGAQITRLDSLALHDNISLSMADVLSQHSTLFIKSYGRATESTAEFRGTSPSHTQVLWNGLRINSPMLGTLDFSTIPSFFVDEANLYHGASSINLTGGGLGGAVELKTIPVTVEGTALQYIQGIGSYKTYDQFLRATHTTEHWSTSTRVVYSRSDNDFMYTNYDKIVDGVHPREHNKSGYFSDFHALQDVYYNDHKGNRMGLMLWYSHTKRGLPFLSVDYKKDTDFTNEQVFNIMRAIMTWDHVVQKWKTGVKAGYQYQDMAYDYFTTFGGRRTDITNSQSLTNMGFLQANADYMPSEHWLLQGNSELSYNHVRSYDKSPFHFGDNYRLGRVEGSLSLKARWRPVKSLSFALILREELYKDYFVPLIPVAFAEYVLYRPWNLTLKASVARNYRYPSMDDLYYQPGGNPNLKPEEGFTYDGGVEFNIPMKHLTLKGNASAFDSYITDWIQWLPNPKGFWEPNNLKKVHNYGVEMNLQADWFFAADWKLHAIGNYAYTPSVNKGEPLNANDQSYGKQLCYVPIHQANVCAGISWRTWCFTWKWNYYSERYTTTSNEVDLITGRLKPYYMSDVSLEKRFCWHKVHASIKGVINNILGTEYVTVLSHPMAPRNFEIFLEITPQW